MRLQERNLAVNDYLNRIESKFTDFLIGHVTCFHEYSTAAIRNLVLGIKKDNRPFLGL
jgi:hypothetical protein